MDITVLCLGDSNTCGYDPRAPFGGRLPPAERWPGILAASTGWQVVEKGQNGRQIPHGPGDRAALRQELAGCPAPQALVVMLGTNDLLCMPAPSAQEVAGRMAAFLGSLLPALNLPAGRLLLVAPPPVQLQGMGAQGRRLWALSGQLGAQYGALARRLGAAFADAGGWQLPLAFDGVHFTPQGHAIFAAQVELALRALLARPGPPPMGL